MNDLRPVNEIESINCGLYIYIYIYIEIYESKWDHMQLIIKLWSRNFKQLKRN